MLFFNKEKLQYVYEMESLISEILERVHTVETLAACGVEIGEDLIEELSTALEYIQYSPGDFNGTRKRLNNLDTRLVVLCAECDVENNEHFQERFDYISTKLREYCQGLPWVEEEPGTSA